MKKILPLIIVIIIFVVIIGYFGMKKSEIPDVPVTATTTITSYKDASYKINGQVVQLVNGISEVQAAPGSASKITTKYFGNEITKDINNDGKDDIVFLLTQSTGGTGVMYYAVAALNTSTGYIGSEALLLGDRIAPQTTESGPGNSIIVNYADRKPGESFTTRPSVGKSIRLLLDPVSMQFGEVVQNFEGEADPKRMSLGMHKWEWVKTEMNDGKVITPKKPGVFGLTFKNNGEVVVTSDCNQINTTYTSKDATLSFGTITSTKMACDGSQEQDFIFSIRDIASYFFTSKGELIMEIKFDSGTVTFK